jgi:hypothetical protein
MGAVVGNITIEINNNEPGVSAATHVAVAPANSTAPIIRPQIPIIPATPVVQIRNSFADFSFSFLSGIGNLD